MRQKGCGVSINYDAEKEREREREREKEKEKRIEMKSVSFPKAFNFKMRGDVREADLCINEKRQPINQHLLFIHCTHRQTRICMYDL